MTDLTFPIRSDKLRMTVRVDTVIASEQSTFQQIDIVETAALGRILLLDGHIQLSTFDEASYHELLVWIPLLNVAAPRRALVVGGGDGGVLRELCRHHGLERIDMVEIDEAVVRLCREHLPSVSAGAFEDARVRLSIGDAFPFMKAAEPEYDLIVVDATDLYEDEQGELSEMLFTKGFYGELLRVLSPNGYVVTQADNPVFCPESTGAVRQAFSDSFPSSGTYSGLVPSFGGFSGFCWGSRGAEPSAAMPTIPMGGPRLRHVDPASYTFALSDAWTRFGP